MTHTQSSPTPRNRSERDASFLSPVTPQEDARTILINKISWGAVLAGAVLALVIQLVLNMLGIGIGAATLDPGSAGNPSAAAMSIGAGIWFAVSGIIAAFVGGYAAGRLSGKPKESTAGWHGLTTWAVSTLVIFYLLTTTVGSILGGTFRTLGSVASTTAQTAAQVAAQPGSEDAFSSVEQALRAVTGSGTEGMSDAAIATVRSAVTGDGAQSQQARDEAAQAIAQSRNIPIEEAKKQVAQYEQQYRQTAEQTKQTVTNVADTATTATSTGALAGAISLILGALAAWFGGRKGAVAPTLTSGTSRRGREGDVQAG